MTPVKTKTSSLYEARWGRGGGNGETKEKLSNVSSRIKAEVHLPKQLKRMCVRTGQALRGKEKKVES